MPPVQSSRRFQGGGFELGQLEFSCETLAHRERNGSYKTNM